MTTKVRGDGQETSSDGGAVAPYGLLFVSWLVPGLGHLILGKKQRALVFSLVVLAGFVTGVLLNGEVGVPMAGNPFSWLSTIACAGNGILYLVRLVWLNGIGGILSHLPMGLDGGGDPVAAGFGYGKTFLITAGLMNLLIVLDVSDIVRGAKD